MSLSRFIPVCNGTVVFVLSPRNDDRNVNTLEKIAHPSLCKWCVSLFFWNLNISFCKGFRMFPYCRQFETFTIYLCAVLLFVSNWLSCFVRFRTCIQLPTTLSSTSTEAKFRFTVIVVSTFLTSFKTGKGSS